MEIKSATLSLLSHPGAPTTAIFLKVLHSNHNSLYEVQYHLPNLFAVSCCQPASASLHIVPSTQAEVCLPMFCLSKIILFLKCEIVLELLLPLQQLIESKQAWEN